jgi:hypothetical protein
MLLRLQISSAWERLLHCVVSENVLACACAVVGGQEFALTSSTVMGGHLELLQSSMQRCMLTGSIDDDAVSAVSTCSF